MKTGTNKSPGILIGADFKINGITITGTYDHNTGWLLGGVKDFSLQQIAPREIAAYIPDLDIKELICGYRNVNHKSQEYLLRIDIGSAINLSDLPLIGSQFSPLEGFSLEDLCISVKGSKPDRAKKMKYGLSIRAKLHFSGETYAFALPLEPGDSKSAAGSTETGLESPAPSTPAGSSAQDSNTLWIPLGKAAGPVYLKRIGLKYTGEKLYFLLDALLSMGPLTLACQGLSVGSSLKKFSPEFDLQGFGLSYAKGSLMISGAFLRDRSDDSYMGTAVIKTPGISIAALGAYQEINGQTSLFIYAALTSSVGVGPPFFEITGISAGFGYNRTINVPDVYHVKEFPLVSVVTGGKDMGKDPLEVLNLIKHYLPAARGQLFLAFGIKFTSFKMLDSFALLLLRLGQKIELDLLGISRLSIPANTANPLAQVELALKAGYDFYEHSLKIEGVLTPASFILSRNCRLTGGFAFYSWFAGSHAGDFVYTMGGYHPQFNVPSHYPRVPRLGFHWQVTPELSLKGQMYYALVPTALMAGGRLEALFEIKRTVGFDIGIAGASLTGKIRAWFIMGADFIISWLPYFYKAELYVNIGITATFKGRVKFLWVTKSVEKNYDLSLSADLRIWGPEFSGIAHVDWSIISFDIEFGANQKPAARPITWNQFKSSFLPDNQQITSINVEEGLKKQLDNQVTVINAADLAIVTHSIIPLSVVNKDSNMKLEGNHFSLAPMDVHTHIDSSQTIRILDQDQAGKDVSAQFVFEPVFKNAPSALWGPDFNPGLKDSNQLIKDLLMGIRIKPLPKKKPDTTEDKPVSDFTYDIELRESAFKWQDFIAYQSDKSLSDEKRRQKIRDISSKSQARDQILAGLGLDTALISLEALEKSTLAEFLTAPQIWVKSA